jgi:hypothetical protein
MVRQLSTMLVLLAVATPLQGQTTGEERERQREVERLEAQREALERAREAVQRSQERLERELRRMEEEGEGVALRREALRFPALEGMRTVLQGMTRPRLGISLRGDQGGDVDRQGARIQAVMEDGPAARAGLQEGDIITEIGGISLLEPLADPDDEAEAAGEESPPVARLLALVRALEPGDPVIIRYLREGELRSAEVVAEELGPRISVWTDGDEDATMFRFRAPRAPEVPRVLIRPRTPGAPGAPSPLARAWDVCVSPWGGVSGSCGGGLELADLNSGLADYFGSGSGALVLEVPEDSELGLESGDVILAVGDRTVEDAAQARRILASYDQGEEVRFRVMRHGDEITVTGRMDER